MTVHNGMPKVKGFRFQILKNVRNECCAVQNSETNLKCRQTSLGLIGKEENN